MTQISATALRKDLFNTLSNTIKYNDVVSISTKDGNAVLLSQEEYEGIMATLELSGDPEVKKAIIDGKNTELDECVKLSAVDW